MSTIFHNKKIWLTLDQMMYSASGLLLNLYLAKVLTMYNFGLFASLVVCAYLLLSITQSLIMQPAQVHMAKVKKPQGYKLYLLQLLVCTSLILFVLSFIANILPLEIIDVYRPFIALFIIYCIVFIAFDFFRKYFLAEDKVKESFAIQSLHSCFLLVSMASLSYFHVTSLSSVFIVLSISYIPSLLLALVYYTKGLSFKDYKLEQSYYSAHFIDGQWLLYTSVVQWLSSNIYVLMSGMLISIEALGVLRLVQSVFGVFNLYLQVIENHLLPRMAKAFSQSTVSCYSLFKKEYGRILLPGLTVLLIIGVFAKQGMGYFGGISYTKYAMVVQGTCVLYAVILLGYGLRMMVRISGMNKIYFFAYTMSLAMSLFIYKNLFNNFGVMGAVMGLILNQLILQLTWVAALIQKQYTVWRLYI